MEKQTMLQPTQDEQKLIRIARRLPPERVSQLIDFARFLELQIAKTYDDNLLEQDETGEEIVAENEQWDTLLAADESQRLLEQMADEVLAEIQAGRAKPMIFTEAGNHNDYERLLKRMR
jgi:elongation factor P--beta-lysine ligase